MDWACGTHEGGEKCVIVEKTVEEHSDDRGIGGRIILKWVLLK
jgi:hypothetical protein